MARSEIALTAFALTAALAACGGDEKPSEGDQPDAGGPGRRPAEQQCLRTEDLTQVLAPSALGGPFAQLAVDGSYLYFNQATSLFRVPTAGGQAEQLFSDDSGYGLSFSVRDGRVLVATDTGVLELMQASEPQVLAELPATAVSDLFTGAMPFVFAPERAYFAGYSSSGSDPVIFALDLSSGVSTSLGTAGADIEVLAQIGDTLYWTESDPDPAAPYANILKRLPVSGGTVEEVGVDLGELHLAFELLGATSDGVVLDVSLVLGADNRDNAAVTAAGLYSQPLMGGKALQLVENSALDLTSLFGAEPKAQAVQAGDQLFLLSGTLQSATVYSLAKGALTPEKRFCLDLGGALVESMTVSNGSVYLGLADGNKSSILRRDL